MLLWKIITDMKAKIGNDKVVLGLSGGVDSTVAGNHNKLSEIIYTVLP